LGVSERAHSSLMSVTVGGVIKRDINLLSPLSGRGLVIPVFLGGGWSLAPDLCSVDERKNEGASEV